MSALFETQLTSPYSVTADVHAPRQNVVSLASVAPPPRMRKFPKQTRSRLMVMSIKQAALELVTRRDCQDDIKVIDIADICGISTGSLYQYFDCLEGIISAVYEDVILSSLARRGSEMISVTDSNRLAGLLGALDQLFGRRYYEEFYAQHLRSGRCAADVAQIFTRNFGSYFHKEAPTGTYWDGYLTAIQ